MASPDDRVMCPYHLSLHLFTEVGRSLYGLMALSVLVFSSLLVMRSLYNIPGLLHRQNKSFHGWVCLLVLLLLDEIRQRGQGVQDELLCGCPADVDSFQLWLTKMVVGWQLFPYVVSGSCLLLLSKVGDHW